MTNDNVPTGICSAPAPVTSNRILSARPHPHLSAGRARQHPPTAALVTRRSLIRSSFWAGAGVTVAGLLLGFVNFFWPRRVQGFGGVITVPAARVPRPGDPPARIIEGKFYLVNLPPGGGMPEAFAETAAPSQQGGMLALYQRCPHLGCSVPWRGDFAATETKGIKGWFRCPCHASTYSLAGVRVHGPAPRSMDTMAVTRNADGSVTVDTAVIKPGGPDNPRRAVLG
jgi:cytochrome b6-f complex iron-sulfur subunit